MFAVYVVSVFALLSICIVLLYRPLNDLKTYLTFIKKPEDLLAFKELVFLVEYPNTSKKFVRIGGQDLSSNLVVNWMLHDIACLKRKGFQIDKEFLYDERAPLPADVFEKLHAEYKMAVHHSKQGSRFFGTKKPKPVAPYDFSKVNILPPMNRVWRDMRG
jgi:hypothetical protein